MITPVPAAPPPPPAARVFRVHKRRRPVPPASAPAAATADGSRCVTRDPEASRPPPRRDRFEPSWLPRRGAGAPREPRRWREPWPRDPRLRLLFDCLGIDRRSP